MVVGERQETIEEKHNRHIMEMKADIEGWKSELEYAKLHNDTRYESYCDAMITICLNTLEALNKLHID